MPSPGTGRLLHSSQSVEPSARTLRFSNRTISRPLVSCSNASRDRGRSSGWTNSRNGRESSSSLEYPNASSKAGFTCLKRPSRPPTQSRSRERSKTSSKLGSHVDVPRNTGSIVRLPYRTRAAGSAFGGRLDEKAFGRPRAAEGLFSGAVGALGSANREDALHPRSGVSGHGAEVVVSALLPEGHGQLGRLARLDQRRLVAVDLEVVQHVAGVLEVER